MHYLTDPKIDDLRKLVKQKYGVAAFIGAGCSAALKIPLWNDLLVGLNQEFNFYPDDNAVLDAIKIDGYPKVASNIKTKADDAAYKELVKKFTKPVACHFTSLHIELVALSKTILTTNYDESFEETLKALGRFHPALDWEFTTSSLGNFSIKGVGLERNVYHIHGSTSTGDVVLTEESYYSQYDKPLSGVQVLVTQIFSNYTTIFVGFSFSDKDFVNFLEKAIETIRVEKKDAGAPPPQHYCILSDNLEKDYFTGKDLKGDDDAIDDWKTKGIIFQDNTRFAGKTVFTFSADALDIIDAAGFDPAVETHLVSLVRRVVDNQEKLFFLNKLNIEVIYFEGNEYLQIEYILRKLNEPVAASAATFIP
jgi:NAD-dependent SIR2 family protein deacetylase